MSTLTIHGFREAMINNDLELRRVLEKLSVMEFGDGDVILSCSPRRESGFMEWVASFLGEGAPVFTLGCIQRQPGDEMEFHS